MIEHRNGGGISLEYVLEGEVEITLIANDLQNHFVLGENITRRSILSRLTLTLIVNTYHFKLVPRLATL